MPILLLGNVPSVPTQLGNLAGLHFSADKKDIKINALSQHTVAPLIHSFHPELLEISNTDQNLKV
jgi:hypothetical protein